MYFRSLIHLIILLTCIFEHVNVSRYPRFWAVICLPEWQPSFTAGGSLAAVEANLNVLPRRPDRSHGVERLRPLPLFVNMCHPVIERLGGLGLTSGLRGPRLGLVLSVLLSSLYVLGGLAQLSKGFYIGLKILKCIGYFSPKRDRILFLFASTIKLGLFCQKLTMTKRQSCFQIFSFSGQMLND